MKTRLTLEMTVPEIIKSLSQEEEGSDEYNPGAMAVLVEIIEKFKNESMKLLTTLLRIDGTGTYGSKLWVLFKDDCGSDLDRLIDKLENME